MRFKLQDLLFLENGICHYCMDEEYDHKYLCYACRNKLIYNYEEKHLSNKTKVHFPIMYTGYGKSIIGDYKFRNKTYLYKALGQLLVEYLVKNNQIDFDCIITVPMTKRKRNKKGYDHCRLIGEYVGKKLGIEYIKNKVTKTRETKDQHSLELDNRQDNLKGAFHIEQGTITGKKVLLIDDILTTGITLTEITKTLTQDNPKSIYQLVVASSS